jgi:hypothetical protein
MIGRTCVEFELIHPIMIPGLESYLVLSLFSIRSRVLIEFPFELGPIRGVGAVRSPPANA